MIWFWPIVAIASAALAGAVIVNIAHKITRSDIRNNVKAIPVPGGLKYKIHEAKQHAVSVGIYEKGGNLLETREFRSEEGVSESLKRSVGMEYTI